MYQYVLIRKEDLPDGSPGWKLEQKEDNSGWFFGGPLIDFDCDELNRIAETMQVGEQKIIEI